MATAADLRSGLQTLDFVHYIVLAFDLVLKVCFH